MKVPPWEGGRGVIVENAVIIFTISETTYLHRAPEVCGGPLLATDSRYIKHYISYLLKQHIPLTRYLATIF